MLHQYHHESVLAHIRGRACFVNPIAERGPLRHQHRTGDLEAFQRCARGSRYSATGWRGICLSSNEVVKSTKRTARYYFDTFIDYLSRWIFHVRVCPRQSYQQSHQQDPFRNQGASTATHRVRAQHFIRSSIRFGLKMLLTRQGKGSQVMHSRILELSYRSGLSTTFLLAYLLAVRPLHGYMHSGIAD